VSHLAGFSPTAWSADGLFITFSLCGGSHAATDETLPSLTIAGEGDGLCGASEAEGCKSFKVRGKGMKGIFVAVVTGAKVVAQARLNLL
jgi:hypothetical protein